MLIFVEKKMAEMFISENLICQGKFISQKKNRKYFFGVGDMLVYRKKIILWLGLQIGI